MRITFSVQSDDPIAVTYLNCFEWFLPSILLGSISELLASIEVTSIRSTINYHLRLFLGVCPWHLIPYSDRKKVGLNCARFVLKCATIYPNCACPPAELWVFIWRGWQHVSPLLYNLTEKQLKWIDLILCWIVQQFISCPSKRNISERGEPLHCVFWLSNGRKRLRSFVINCSVVRAPIPGNREV